MNFKQFLNEAPLMSTYSKETVKDIVPTYKSFMKHESLLTHIGKYKGYEFYLRHIKKSAGSTYQYALIDSKKEEIVCISSLYENSTADGKYMQQGLIYKDDSLSSSYIDYIFNYVLDIHKVITSDTEQTIGGKKFWIKLCNRYMTNSKYELGYVVHKTKEFIKFSDDWESEFEEQYNEDSKKAHNLIYIKKSKR